MTTRALRTHECMPACMLATALQCMAMRIQHLAKFIVLPHKVHRRTSHCPWLVVNQVHVCSLPQAFTQIVNLTQFAARHVM